MKHTSHVSHHTVGFFLVVAGVVSLSTILSSARVLALSAEAVRYQPEVGEYEYAEPVPGVPRATREIPVSFDLAPTWSSVEFDRAPYDVAQPITYVRITSQSPDPIQLDEIGFVLETNTPFDGGVALVKIPEGSALVDTSVFGYGLPVESHTTSTIGMTTVTTDGKTPTITTIPLVSGVVLPAGGSMIVALTLDNAPSEGVVIITPSFTGVTWKNMITHQVYTQDAVTFASPRVTFTSEE